MLTRKTRTITGLSLVEIIVALLIFGLLIKASHALYTSYIQKSNREAAKMMLRKDVSLMEISYSESGSYLKSSNSWPQNIFESYITGVTGNTYSVSIVPKTPRTRNREAFSIMATPLADSVQATDSAGILCINEQGLITENSVNACNTTTWNKDLCKNGLVIAPAIAVCAWGNCSELTICGACSSGAAPEDNLGSCSGSYVGGDCMGNCSDGFINGACNGNCTNSTVCGACAGNCTGVNHDGCS